LKGILLVKLDKSKLPAWCPSTDIYLDFETYGYDQVVGAIKLRAQEMGSIVKSVTAIDKAKILENKVKFIREKEKFLESENGVNAALLEIDKLFKEIERICKEINTETVIKIKFQRRITKGFIWQVPTN
jgi:hypothetical protein